MVDVYWYEEHGLRRVRLTNGKHTRDFREVIYMDGSEGWEEDDENDFDMNEAIHYIMEGPLWDSYDEGHCRNALAEATHMIEEAAEVAVAAIKDAHKQGVNAITLIHGAPDVRHHTIATQLRRGGIKWLLRGCLARGEWNEWVYGRQSRKHVIEDGAMTLALKGGGSWK